jgi:hypothetical protein
MRANGKTVVRALLVAAFCGLLPLLNAGPGCCGNLEAVEKSAEELETLNRAALSQLPGLPRNGSVDLKAYITVEGGKSSIRIDQQRITIDGASGRIGSQNPAPPGVAVSAAPTSGKIEYLEKNSPQKTSPGGSNVR